MGFIYKITNLVNGKSYIGQTIQLVSARWQGHLSDLRQGRAAPKLQYAFNKYGESNFTLQTIEECLNSDLDNRERYWIEYYDSYENGYNSTLGGQYKSNKYDYEQIATKYLEVKSLRETAKYFHCNVKTVQSALKALNIDAAQIGYHRNPRQADTTQYQTYYNDYSSGMGVVEVSKKYGVAPATVSKAIKHITGKTPRELMKIKHQKGGI